MYCRQESCPSISHQMLFQCDFACCLLQRLTESLHALPDVQCHRRVLRWTDCGQTCVAHMFCTKQHGLLVIMLHSVQVTLSSSRTSMQHKASESASARRNHQKDNGVSSGFLKMNSAVFKVLKSTAVPQSTKSIIRLTPASPTYSVSEQVTRVIAISLSKVCAVLKCSIQN